MKRGLLVTAVLSLLLALGAAGAAAAEGQPAPSTNAPAPKAADQASGRGCCGGPQDGWLVTALANADLDQLKAAFARLDTDADAKALLATPEAVTIRKIVETGKLPEVSLEDWRKLEQSRETSKLLRALSGALRLRRILTT